MDTLETRPLQPRFGLEVLGVDLSRLDDALYGAILRLWQREPLLLIHRRDTTDPELPRLAKRTTLFLRPGEFPVPA